MKQLLIILIVCVSVLALDLGFRGEAKRRHSGHDPQQDLPASQKVAQQNGSELSETTRVQLAALMAEKEARTAVEQKIDSQLIIGAKMQRAEPLPAGIASINLDLQLDTDGRDEVDISGDVTDNLLDTIVREGGAIENSYPQFKAVRASLPPPALAVVAALDEVRFINRATSLQLAQAGSAISTNPASGFDQRAENVKKELRATLPAVVSASSSSAKSEIVPATGNVTSEGDVTHTANQARSSFNVNGSGVKIGVISDSVKGLAQSQASGNLPNVTVLAGRSGVDGGTFDSGEGTAILEIIADLAPGAQLFFSTGKGGPAAFAQNILDLQAAGCNIIVDDLEYDNESPFQDDVVARAVNTVTAAGVLYFS